jgi:hypothetical protein
MTPRNPDYQLLNYQILFAGRGCALEKELGKIESACSKKIRSPEFCG